MGENSKTHITIGTLSNKENILFAKQANYINLLLLLTTSELKLIRVTRVPRHTKDKGTDCAGGWGKGADAKNSLWWKSTDSSAGQLTDDRSIE